MKNLIIIISTAFLLTCNCFAQNRGAETLEIRDVEFDSLNPQQIEDVISKNWKIRKVKAKLFIPKAPSHVPAPAVIVLHGSGGIVDGREYMHAGQFNAQGYFALVIDTYGSRGADKMPYNQRIVEVSAFTQTADAIGALDFLSKLDALDPNRIASIGSSVGGMSSTMLNLESMVSKYTDSPLRFAANAALYAPCFSTFRTVKASQAPLLVVVGDKDEALDVVECKRAYDALGKVDSISQYRVIQGAAHGWDSDAPLQFYRITNFKECTTIIEDDGQTYFVKTNKLMPGNREKFKEFFKCALNGYTVGKNTDANTQALRYIKEFFAQSFAYK